MQLRTAARLGVTVSVLGYGIRVFEGWKSA